MSNADEIRIPRDEPIFIVGTSGRLPLRTICVLELMGSEVPWYRHRWITLLGDRLRIATTEPIPHPSRIVNGKYGARTRSVNVRAAQALGQQCARRFAEALDEFPKPLIAHMPKQHSQQAEQRMLRWLCTRLAGRPSGLAVIHTSQGITWYRLTTDGPVLEPLPPESPALMALPCPAAEVELLLTPAKLGAYAAYQHRCYPHVSYRPTWLPLELPWADEDIAQEILT
ncbi:hypothetical protein SGR_3361 [Streptomyces griseus subsp. griseus NBRC 13350]|uniref:Uncharacterized protein n=1 Tax=Streptomyces griseus subsp. griseus (strain JCM 4626 / CBS 651.72 / NBRC 13350 / KCC S-0626 / ISP 5235) TaxID=455632 RepID=B1VM80_STRGG|nr:hypothetical protein SGR_3361 [Streptomyces griseus subsp. griseus NBRC 13350]